ncbi:unnamed protein product [Euphydryas editha]|uniref:Uncharacterized protein n=1 Tax=Euphydryas editha TaxID=104508 RepID=A0AAU9UFY7_EUPED|nr:unnamed protein product [Euphydryas editha]
MFTARTGKTSQLVTPIEEDRSKTTVEPNPVSSAPVAIKPTETSKSEEQQFPEKQCPPTYIPPKIISHSPKISPSSIPNPNPSVTTTKQVEPGYPSYGGYMYSVPGYSAFQPVSYSGIVQPSSTTIPPAINPESNNADFIPFPVTSVKDTPLVSKENEIKENKVEDSITRNSLPKIETDFEDQFMPEIIPAVSLSDDNKTKSTESKMSVTSLTQGSGAIVTIPSQVVNKDIKKKLPERFSLKTSIPISKIDMKCVNNPPDSLFQNNLAKKPFNPAFHTPNVKENAPKIEIQSNIIIKSASNESDSKDISAVTPPNNSISTLINAAEVINKTDNQYKTSEIKPEITNESKEPIFHSSPSNACPLFNPINLESNKPNFQTKSADSAFNDAKNQIVFIQNKNPSNTKMLVAIQQQNPQVLLQRTNYDPKNLQTPSRPSNQPKKCKEELVNDNSTSSKVVSLKRMHQDNCDENDFENLITENQIYGNKIVVKEKSQGTLQEQDLKQKTKMEKSNQAETKNVTLQPNFVYLSNVQFPANLMMIKNNSKVNNESNKMRVTVNENKQNDIIPVPSNDTNATNKTQNIPVGKEIHVLKSNNNVLQTLPGKNGKSDLLFQTLNQKVIMNPQIVYQVPMIVDTDTKLNQTFVKGEYPKIAGQTKRDIQKTFEQTKTNDKLYIACPYQMDSKLQPKIVITNIRPKLTKVDEISSLDIYEQRKRLRRLKYLSNRDPKTNQNNDNQKTEAKKGLDNLKNIITPEKMKAEIYKEFSNTKIKIEDDSTESESDYGEDELEKYNSIIEEYGDFTMKNDTKENIGKQAEFLSNFRLASKNEFEDRELDRQERIIRCDAVALAYIAAGRIDCLLNEKNIPEQSKACNPNSRKINTNLLEIEQGVDQQIKKKFLSNLHLMKASPQYKEDYEKVWQEIVKERKRRDSTDGSGQILKQPRLQKKIVELDPKGQLKILTEIKKHVYENNNLIKKRLDSFCEDGDSIKVLAEKNFSELNRLSKMADRSVKHFSGQDTRKRDLNPGFDSENIQKQTNPTKYYPNINIPSISKIISLKTTESVAVATSTQATSMDEPRNSAAGINEMFVDDSEKVQDFGCQVDGSCSWTGVDAIVKAYKEYEIARKKEIANLHKLNTSLRVESAHITRAASRDSDRARALLAERRNLANEERIVRNSIQWLRSVVDIIRNYEEEIC